MKYLSLKYLVVFIMFLFLTGIIEDYKNPVNDKINGIACNQPVIIELQGKDNRNLEFNRADSKPSNHGEKVETTVVPGPVLNYSEVSYLNFSKLPVLILSKKLYSLFSLSSLLATKAFQISSLVNILRI